MSAGHARLISNSWRDKWVYIRKGYNGVVIANGVQGCMAKGKCGYSNFLVFFAIVHQHWGIRSMGGILINESSKFISER